VKCDDMTARKAKILSLITTDLLLEQVVKNHTSACSHVRQSTSGFPEPAAWNRLLSWSIMLLRKSLEIFKMFFREISSLVNLPVQSVYRSPRMFRHDHTDVGYYSLHYASRHKKKLYSKSEK